jgi:hypothetical protein
MARGVIGELCWPLCGLILVRVLYGQGDHLRALLAPLLLDLDARSLWPGVSFESLFYGQGFSICTDSCCFGESVLMIFLPPSASTCFLGLSRAALEADVDVISDPFRNNMSFLCCFVQIFRAHADVISDFQK